jgi:hypothetical protein
VSTAATPAATPRPELSPWYTVQELTGGEVAAAAGLDAGEQIATATAARPTAIAAVRGQLLMTPLWRGSWPT